MYKVNKNTKIGLEIANQIEHSLYKDYFRTADVSFLTSPDELKSKYNVHIYAENRLEDLKSDMDEFNTHIPGCITSSLEQEYTQIDEILKNTKEVHIDVTFGSNAASTRRIKEGPWGVFEYEENSHEQLPELKFLLNKKVTLRHRLNTDKQNTSILFCGYPFEVCTVQVSAKEAIESAIFLLSKI